MKMSSLPKEMDMTKKDIKTESIQRFTGMVGGFQKTDPTNKTVKRAAEFAVTEMSKKSTDIEKLVFCRVIEAYVQNVAGTNYFMKIEFSIGVNGSKEIKWALVYESIKRKLTLRKISDKKFIPVQEKRKVFVEGMPGGFNTVDSNREDVAEVGKFAIDRMRETHRNINTFERVIQAKEQLIVGSLFFLEIQHDGKETSWALVFKAINKNMVLEKFSSSYFSPTDNFPIYSIVNVNNRDVVEAANFALSEYDNSQGYDGSPILKMERIIEAQLNISHGNRTEEHVVLDQLKTYLIHFEYSRGRIRETKWAKVFEIPLNPRQIQKFADNDYDLKVNLMGEWEIGNPKSENSKEIGKFVVDTISKEINSVYTLEFLGVLWIEEQLVSGENDVIRVQYLEGPFKRTQWATVYESFISRDLHLIDFANKRSDLGKKLKFHEVKTENKDAIYIGNYVVGEYDISTGYDGSEKLKFTEVLEAHMKIENNERLCQVKCEYMRGENKENIWALVSENVGKLSIICFAHQRKDLQQRLGGWQISDPKYKESIEEAQFAVQELNKACDNEKPLKLKKLLWVETNICLLVKMIGTNYLMRVQYHEEGNENQETMWCLVYHGTDLDGKHLHKMNEFARKRSDIFGGKSEKLESKNEKSNIELIAKFAMEGLNLGYGSDNENFGLTKILKSETNGKITFIHLEYCTKFGLLWGLLCNKWAAVEMINKEKMRILRFAETEEEVKQHIVGGLDIVSTEEDRIVKVGKFIVDTLNMNSAVITKRFFHHVMWAEKQSVGGFNFLIRVGFTYDGGDTVSSLYAYVLEDLQGNLFLLEYKPERFIRNEKVSEFYAVDVKRKDVIEVAKFALKEFNISQGYDGCPTFKLENIFSMTTSARVTREIEYIIDFEYSDGKEKHRECAYVKRLGIHETKMVVFNFGKTRELCLKPLMGGYRISDVTDRSLIFIAKCAVEQLSVASNRTLTFVELLWCETQKLYGDTNWLLRIKISPDDGKNTETKWVLMTQQIRMFNPKMKKCAEKRWF